MTLSTNRWRPVDEPASDEEKAALEHIRALLPDDPLCFAWPNVSIPDRRGLPTEIDLLLLNGNGLFVVELKGWHGDIDGKMYDWWHRGVRRPNPLKETQNKARRLKSLLVELREEQHISVPLPYVAPAVVLHGRRSRTRLDERARVGVYGLDGYDVKGVPAFSTFLREPPAHGVRMDKPAVDAIARLLQAAGMETAPRTADGGHGGAERSTSGEVPPQAVPAVPDARGETPAPSVTVARTLWLAEVTEQALLELGVPADRLSAVKAVADEVDVIGLVPDEVVDDLSDVLDGVPLDEVIDRRCATLAILADVDQQGEADVTAPPPVPKSSPPDEPVSAEVLSGRTSPDAGGASRSVERGVAPTAVGGLTIDDVVRLQSVFGDRITTGRARAAIAAASAAPAPAPLRPRSPAVTPPSLRPAQAPVVDPERLLDLARVEALQGRSSAAREMLGAVEARLDAVGVAGWRGDDLRTLISDLRHHTLLSQRLETILASLTDGLPEAPVIPSSVAAPPVGRLWSGGELGPAYSLLARVADVLDRANGTYLSDYIGVERAAQVNARLRRGRPDGGRIRIVGDGTVVSRRDAGSPWFVVGAVLADEWFPSQHGSSARPACDDRLDVAG